SCFVVFSYFFFSSSSDHPYPHSFPTRRSSDLVTDHDRDAAEQTGGAGHTVGSIREQFVAAIEAAFAQVEDIGAGIAVEHVQPHLPRIEKQLADRLTDLRQVDALFTDAHLTGEQVFLAAEADQVQLVAGGAGQHQGAAIEVDGNMVERAALRVDLDRRLAVGIVDLRRDGAHVVRVDRKSV